MTYLVNEIFYTLQGEGYWTGRPAVFCRFSRCNLACSWCDTDFEAAEKLTLRELGYRIGQLAPFDPRDRQMVVLTGGEPALQADDELLGWLHAAGFYVAIETNGTRRLTAGIDWVCVSPKAGTILRVDAADEIKLVYPQDGIDPHDFAHYPASHHWISPMDGPNLAENTAVAVEYVKAHPRWRLNIQTHKVIGVR